MDLGKFSLSLAVKDVDASVKFYESLGFKVMDGGHQSESFPDTGEQRWRMLRQGLNTVGVFQGMFEKNLLNFYPPELDKVRARLIKKGLVQEGSSEGATPIMLEDPDGNPILIEPRK